MIPPWDNCKVAFGIDDAAPLDSKDEVFIGVARLPPGWMLDEVDGAGGRWVAVFSVDGMPLASAGRRVRAALRTVGAITSSGHRRAVNP